MLASVLRASKFGSAGQGEIFTTVWRAVFRFRKRAAAALALLIAAKISALLVPVVLKHIVDELDLSRAPLALPVSPLLAYALLRFLSGLFTELRDMAFAKVTATPVADFTVEVFDRTRFCALLAGFQVYMAKPVDPRELEATVLALAKTAPAAS